MSAKLGRVALSVKNVDDAVRDFSAMFGLSFKTFDIPGMQLRVAIGDHGVEFVQSLAPDQAGAPVPTGGPLQGVCIAVDDVERTREHLASLGHPTIYSLPLQSGRQEYGIAPVHGLPVMFYQECGYFDVIAQ